MAKLPRISPSSIDAEQLERIARIARGLPGRLVSVKQQVPRRRLLTEDAGRSAGEGRAALPPMLRIDGVAANEILARYEHAGLA
jgi:hypothetical protein